MRYPKNDYNQKPPLEHKSVKRSGRKRSYFLVAAAVAVFFMVSTFALMFLSEQGTDTLYAAYYSTNDLPFIIQRDESNTTLEQGVLAFQNRNYSEALAYFESYEVSNPETDVALYLYKGATYLELNNFDKAIEEFELAIDSNSIDATKGFWFKALTYLKAGDEVRAKYVLTDISQHVWYFNHDKSERIAKETRIIYPIPT